MHAAHAPESKYAPTCALDTPARGTKQHTLGGISTLELVSSLLPRATHTLSLVTANQLGCAWGRLHMRAQSTRNTSYTRECVYKSTATSPYACTSRTRAPSRTHTSTRAHACTSHAHKRTRAPLARVHTSRTRAHLSHTRAHEHRTHATQAHEHRAQEHRAPRTHGCAHIWDMGHAQ